MVAPTGLIVFLKLTPVGEDIILPSFIKFLCVLLGTPRTTSPTGFGGFFNVMPLCESLAPAQKREKKSHKFFKKLLTNYSLGVKIYGL